MLNHLILFRADMTRRGETALSEVTARNHTRSAWISLDVRSAAGEDPADRS